MSTRVHPIESKPNPRGFLGFMGGSRRRQSLSSITSYPTLISSTNSQAVPRFDDVEHQLSSASLLFDISPNAGSSSLLLSLSAPSSPHSRPGSPPSVVSSSNGGSPQRSSSPSFFGSGMFSKFTKSSLNLHPSSPASVTSANSSSASSPASPPSPTSLTVTPPNPLPEVEFSQEPPKSRRPATTPPPMTSSTAHSRSKSRSKKIPRGRPSSLIIPPPPPLPTTEKARLLIPKLLKANGYALLEEVMVHGVKSVEMLEDHCKKGFCEELVHCHRALAIFKDVHKTPDSNIRVAARKVFDSFIKKGADHEVNLPQDVFEEVAKEITQNTCSRHMFDPALVELRNLLVPQLISLRMTHTLPFLTALELDAISLNFHQN